MILLKKSPYLVWFVKDLEHFSGEAIIESILSSTAIKKELINFSYA